MFSDLFYSTLDQCRLAAPGKHKFRFKNKLLSLDSSTISLCLSLFPWAKFRRTKGAVKLHMLLDHDGYLPTYAYISNGKKHDVNIARKVPLSADSIVTMDRGYNDYNVSGYLTASSQPVKIMSECAKNLKEAHYDGYPTRSGGKKEILERPH